MTTQPTQIDCRVYDYSKDNISFSKDTNEYEVVYKCQKSRKKFDTILKDNTVILRLFYRKTKLEPFKDIGIVQNRKVLEERSKDEDRLTMQFIIPKTEELVIPAPTTKGQGKYKIPIFKALNVWIKTNCYMQGIIEVFPIS